MEVNNGRRIFMAPNLKFTMPMIFFTVSMMCCDNSDYIFITILLPDSLDLVNEKFYLLYKKKTTNTYEKY